MQGTPLQPVRPASGTGTPSPRSSHSVVEERAHDGDGVWVGVLVDGDHDVSVLSFHDQIRMAAVATTGQRFRPA